MDWYNYNNWDEHLPTKCEECGMALSSSGDCNSDICFEVDMM